jgi:hypothetical protein
MPCQRGDRAADGLLQVFRHPPVVFLFEVAHGDDAGAGPDGEFLLRGGPADEGGGAVDAQEDEGGGPALGGRVPDVGVAVCRSQAISIGFFMISLTDCVANKMGKRKCSQCIPCEQVTIIPLPGAISTPVTVLSWPFNSSLSENLPPERLYSSTLLSRATARVERSAEKE